MKTARSDLTSYRRYYQKLTELAKKPNARNYVTAIFTLLSVSLFGWYAIRPTLQTILFLRREIRDLTKVNDQMEQKIATLIEAQNALQAVQQDLPLVAQALPQSPEVLNIVLQLRNLAQSSGASIAAIQVSQTPLAPKTPSDSSTSQTPSQGTAGAPVAAVKRTERTVTAVPISVTLGGNYETTRSFLTGILSLRRMLTIDQVNITPDKDSATGQTTGTTLRLVIKLNAYYLE